MNDVGGALLPQLMTPAQCATMLDLYDDDSLFCSTVDMGNTATGKANTATSNGPTHTRSKS